MYLALPKAASTAPLVPAPFCVLAIAIDAYLSLALFTRRRHASATLDACLGQATQCLGEEIVDLCFI
jgi:hypothetical protein